MTADQTPARRAGADVRRLVRQVAVDVHGANVTDQPVPGPGTLTRPVLDDPLSGVRAADLVRRVALAELRGHADTARAAGRSWEEIGAALGLTDAAVPTGEAAFAWLVDDQPPARDDTPTFRVSSTWWRCTECGERVSDYGPYEPHPDDREDGHTPDCPRQSAALAAWRAEVDR